ISTPSRYCALKGSTKIRMPERSSTSSSSSGPSSIFKPYWKPEHPPGSTATRSPVSLWTPCSWMNSATFSVAVFVNVTIVSSSPGIRPVRLSRLVSKSSPTPDTHAVGRGFSRKRGASRVHPWNARVAGHRDRSAQTYPGPKIGSTPSGLLQDVPNGGGEIVHDHHVGRGRRLLLTAVAGSDQQA